MNQEMNDLINTLKERNIEFEDFKEFEYKHFKFKSLLLHMVVFSIVLVMANCTYFSEETKLVIPFTLSMILCSVISHLVTCFSFKKLDIGTNYLLNRFRNKKSFERKVYDYLNNN